MNKKNTITLRLTDDQLAWLGALSRRSKRSVRERITRDHLHIIRQLIGESTNLNQLAKQANTYGFFAVADHCVEISNHISQLIKQLKDDR